MSETILELGLNDIPELELLPMDEYELQVVGKPIVMSGESQKSGDPYKMLKLGFKPTVPELREVTPTIYHTFSLPVKGDDKEQRTTKLRRVKDFCDAIGYEDPTGNLDPQQLPGKTCTCKVDQKEDDMMGTINVIKKFL